MISIFPAESRFSADNGWLRSSFSFSFGPYNDPENTSFGPMRVLNDDFVAPEKGFGAHPHSDMEVVSIVLNGQLKHQDNLGNVGITSWGEIQRMTAGIGIIHTEYSASKDEELNLLQMWFMPEQRGLIPSYEITRFDIEALKEGWIPVVSKQPAHHIAKIHQDITIFLTELSDTKSRTYQALPGRKLFLFVIDGDLTVNGTNRLQTRDSARITDLEQLDITAHKASRLMLIDLP